MASRVNVKFVVMLSLVLGLVFAGVAGVALMVLYKSGAENVRLGDEAMARGDYKAAERFYSRAVFKEQRNVEWIRKWREAMMQKVPENRSAYIDDYQMYAGSVLRALAVAEGESVPAHREYLEELYQRVHSSGAAGAWQALAGAVDDSLVYFKEPPGELLRYRGIAGVRLAQLGSEVRESERERALADLTAALQADPDDDQAAEALMEWHLLQAKAAKANARPEDAAESIRRAGEVIGEFVATHPDSTTAAMALLRYELLKIDESLNQSAARAEREAARRDAIAALAPKAEAAAAAFRRADPMTVDPVEIYQFGQFYGMIDPEAGAALVLEELDRAQAARPDDADVMFIRALSLHNRREYEAAIKLFEQILALPIRRVSLQGLRQFDRQQQSAALRVASAIGLHVMSGEDAAAAKAALERAKDYRRALSSWMADSEPQVMLLDAKLRLAENDPNRAQQLLIQYNERTSNRDLEGLLLLAELSVRFGEPGRAKELLERAIELQPQSVGARLALAGVEARLQNHESAAEHYRIVLSIDPSNETAKRELQVAEALGGASSGDPVVDLLVEADRIARGDDEQIGDDAKAMELLERGMDKHNAEPRIAASLATLRMINGDREGALAAMDRALAAHPDSALARSLRERIVASDSLEATIRLIDESGAPEHVKWVQKSQAYRSNDRAEEADAALAEAARIAPNDPLVVEAQFSLALSRKDIDAARRLADHAAKLDLDRAGGRTYQARVLIAENQLRDAAAILQTAVQQGTATAPTWRLLAILQLQLGRTADSLRSFESALGLNPADLETINLYIRALVQVGREEEALSLARRSEEYGRRSRDFLSLWLDLEAAVGDQALARERREQMAERDPKDLDNLYALASLYMQARAWAKARPLIEQLKAQESSLRVTQLEARWAADQGDLNAARDAFIAYIDRTRQGPTPVTSEPFLAFGRFMIDRGQTELGLEAMAEAAKHQDPERMEADVARGDALFMLGRYAEAEAAYRTVVNADADTEQHTVRKRLVDTLVRLGRFDEAEQAIAAIGAAADEDLALLVQRSIIAEGRGDARRARELADLAVGKFPSDPMAYIRRAQLVLADPVYARDALADLDTALRLRPGNVQALRLRAATNFALEQPDAAIRDLQAAVDAAPYQDDLRLQVLAEMLRRNRENDAANLADAALKLRPTDAALARGLGDTFAAAGRWNRAAACFRKAWELGRDEGSCTMYAFALLHTDPPSLAEADALLRSRDIPVVRSSTLLMVRASLRAKQGRMDEAKADAGAALALCGADGRRLVAWRQGLGDAFPDPATALDVLSALKPSPEQAEWFQLVRAQTMLALETTRSEGQALLRALATDGRDNGVAFTAAGLLSALLYEQGAHEEAVSVLKLGLARNPDSLDLNNNLAYILAVNLENPQEALAYAEKAAALGPQRANVLDTLAAVQVGLGRLEEADATLAKALTLPAAPTDKATILMRQAKVKLARGQGSEARRLVDEAGTLLSKIPNLPDARRQEFEELKREIDAAR